MAIGYFREINTMQVQKEKAEKDADHMQEPGEHTGIPTHPALGRSMIGLTYWTRLATWESRNHPEYHVFASIAVLGTGHMITNYS